MKYGDKGYREIKRYLIGVIKWGNSPEGQVKIKRELEKIAEENSGVCKSLVPDYKLMGTPFDI